MSADQISTQILVKVLQVTLTYDFMAFFAHLTCVGGIALMTSVPIMKSRTKSVVVISRR